MASSKEGDSPRIDGGEESKKLESGVEAGHDEHVPTADFPPREDWQPTADWVAPPATLDVSTFSSGQIVGDRYRIRGSLGRGGMGEVWQAFDFKLRVEVALKSLRRELFRDERGMHLLRKEVLAARQVVSPYVCRVFDLQMANGIELVSMEYIDGRTLLELLVDQAPLELAEASRIASQLLAGLGAIHEAGLIHRDLKPENVMITRSGRVVIMDFGIAKAVAEGSTGTVAGTPAYMAPEQQRGEAVDARADVFAAGVMLAEMIGSEDIGQIEARRRLWSALREHPPLVPEGPWKDVIRRAVAAKADDRYRSARALTRALEEVTLRVEGAENMRPYPGLASFTEADAEFFFGREAEVEALWKKLRRPHLLGLIGPSGAGKSSFVHAGLLPARPEGWRFAACQPGDAPFRSLARALMPDLSGDLETMQELLQFEELDVAVKVVARWRQGGEEALVVVDQFEELFTLNLPEVQSRFATLLGRLPVEADVRVLLSMRDDFLFRCNEQEALAPLFSELTPLGAPGGAALRRALVQPALACGYRFEDEDLVHEMVDEITEERGALPLLAFAASRLWEERDRSTGTLTRTAYEEVGGVGGALAQHAEATLERLGTARRDDVRELFRNLVTVEGTRATREIEDLLSVFDEPEPAREVIDTLIDARLLTSYEVPGTASDEESHRVEIVHESLLAAWPRLVRWQTQDADGAQLRDQLRQAASSWEDRGQPDDLLWTGTSWREHQLWRERYPGGLSATEEAFSGAMAVNAGRRRRRRRAAVTIAFMLMLGVLTTFGVLWRRSEEAQQQTEEARIEAVRSERRAEASQLLTLGRMELDSYPSASLAYAIAGLERADTEAARRLALEALWRGPIASVEETVFTNAEFSPDGEWLALWEPIGGVMGRVPAGRLELWSINGGAPTVFPDAKMARFSPNSDILVLQSDSTLTFWSIPNGEMVRTMEVEGMNTFWILADPARILTLTLAGDETSVLSWPLASGDPNVLALLPSLAPRVPDVDTSGRWLAYSGLEARDRSLYLLDLLASDGMAEKMLGSHPAKIYDVAFHPGGELIASADEEGEIRIWSISSRNHVPIRTLRGYSSFPYLRFDRTGSKLATHADVQTIHIWDLEGPLDADPIVLRRGEVVATFGMAFHPSGHWLASTNAHGVVFWGLDGRYPRVFRKHSKGVFGLAFDPAGRWIASSSWDGSVGLWPLSDEPGRVLLQGSRMWRLEVDLAGRTLAVGESQAGAWLVRPESGSARLLPGDGGYAVAFGPNGGLVAVGARGTIRIWNRARHELVWDLDPGDMHVMSLHFVDTNRLLSGSNQGIHLWRLDDRSSELLYQGVEGKVYEIEVSPDASRILAMGIDLRKFDPDFLLYDLENRSSRRILESHGPQLAALAVHPDWKSAVTSTPAGVIQIGPLSGEVPHQLWGHEGTVFILEVSPNGEWIASGGDDGTVRLWPMPDLERPPLHTLPYEELLEKLRALTNLRVVPDVEGATGYRVDPGPFPGWKTVPTW